MTTSLRHLPKPIPIQLLLHKTTTCLMQPATTSFAPPPPIPQMKKTCLKQPLQNFIQQNGMGGTMHKK